MTDLTAKWLAWFDSWTGSCPNCGEGHEHMDAVDDRWPDHRRVVIACPCGWTRTYEMSSR